MKSPAFQFYTKDWLSSRNVRMMTPEQRGWYIQLLCEAWESEEQGTLPDDEELLKKLAGANDPIATLWQPVMACFKRCDGVLLNQRLVNEKIKQENYAKHQSEAGKKGAQRRWNQRVKATPKQPYSNPIVSPMAKNSFASASAIASSKEEKKAFNSKKTDNVQTSIKRLFTDNWCLEFQKSFGSPYKFEGAKDGLAADSLLSTGICPEKIIEIAKKAWSNQSAFWCKKAVSLSGFSSKFNEIRGEVGDLKAIKSEARMKPEEYLKNMQSYGK